MPEKKPDRRRNPPPPTDADLEALIERYGLRERVRQPEVQARLRDIVARGRAVSPAKRPQPVPRKRQAPPAGRRGLEAERTMLYSIIEFMALGVPVDDMPSPERSLLQAFLGNLDDANGDTHATPD